MRADKLCLFYQNILTHLFTFVNSFFKKNPHCPPKKVYNADFVCSPHQKCTDSHKSSFRFFCFVFRNFNHYPVSADVQFIIKHTAVRPCKRQRMPVPCRKPNPPLSTICPSSPLSAFLSLSPHFPLFSPDILHNILYPKSFGCTPSIHISLSVASPVPSVIEPPKISYFEVLFTLYHITNLHFTPPFLNHLIFI